MHVIEHLTKRNAHIPFVYESATFELSLSYVLQRTAYIGIPKGISIVCEKNQTVS